MTSPKKAEANRRNALKSTGPRTVEGKARASWNATKHGLLSARTLFTYEDAGTFKAFGSRLHADLAPVGELEELLVDRIVSVSWRLRRAAKVEAAVYERRSTPSKPKRSAFSLSALLPEYEDEPDPEPTPDPAPNLALVVLYNGDAARTLTNLSRYEAALERSLYRALHELQRLQAARKAGTVSAPLAVDVAVSGGATQ